ncbi:MAG: siderophore-interacting protein [Rothia sp. (in: high G+C Gram-positive bacteria)]|nr:siderophore-interacting protein [Rothia sp. (in: high G+C Gram-positive bacteria)]
MSKLRTHRQSVIHQFGLFPVTVTRVQRLTDHYMRISLAGSALHYAVEEISDGTGDVVDAYIKLLVPPEGSTEPTDIVLDDGWRAEWFAQPTSERGWMRTYTVRNSRLISADSVPPVAAEFRPAAEADLSVLERDIPSDVIPEIDIDFVLHTDAGGTMGPGASWATQAQVGTAVSFLAPMRGNNLWSSWNPGKASKILVLADETAVPAALSIVRTLANSARADVLLEVPGEGDVMTPEMADIQDAATAYPHVNVRWLPRGCNGSSVVRGEELYRMLREILDIKLNVEYRVSEQVSDQEIVWGLADEDSDYYVFIAGESAVIKTLRRICVNDAGLDKSNISFMGYWKKGRAES